MAAIEPRKGQWLRSPDGYMLCPDCIALAYGRGDLPRYQNNSVPVNAPEAHRPCGRCHVGNWKY